MPQLDIGEYIDRYNPFMYKDEKNRILHFNNYKEVYEKTLEYIYLDCDKGFFDLVVFMKSHCGMDDESAIEFEQLAKKNFRLFSTSRIVWFDVTDWKSQGVILKVIIRSLHFISETEFSEEAFEWAFSEFIKKHKL